jgi:hypothetical protein
MSERASIRLEQGPEGAAVLLNVQELGWAGHQATLTLVWKADVRRSGGIDAERVLLERKFTLSAGEQRVALPDHAARAFAYRGKHLHLALEARLVVDDSVLFDSTISQNLDGFLRPRPATDAASLHSPRDRFSLWANLGAIPPQARLIVLLLMLIGGPVILVNVAIGARDQFVPESQTWLYDHRNSDGESESPLMKALTGSGGLGAMIWLAMQAQLRRYMRFSAQAPAQALSRSLCIKPGELIHGSADVDLKNCEVRLVAYNLERGQYRVKKKNRTETRSFEDPGQAVLVYQQRLPFVGAGVDIGECLAGEVDFNVVFDGLYPPGSVNDTHGLGLALEAQLLHPDFVDQEVVIKSPAVVMVDFWRNR